jgi:hypothetical protein
MRVWLISFFLLFVLVEFHQWFQTVKMPLPLMLLAGVVLAIASNLIGSRWTSFSKSEDSTPPFSDDLTESDPSP